MDRFNKKSNEIEKYILQLIFGLILWGFIFWFRKYMITNDIIKTAQNLGGQYAMFDIFYYVIVIVGISASSIMILRSLVFLFKRIKDK